MEILREVRLKDYKGWHKGMRVYDLNIATGKIFQLAISDPEDTFIVEENHLYRPAINLRSGVKKIRKACSLIISNQKSLEE